MANKKVVWWNPATWFQKRVALTPPCVGRYWPEMGGYYAGVTYSLSGNHHIVVSRKDTHHEAKPFGWVPEEFQKGRLRMERKAMNSLNDGVWNTFAAIGYRELGMGCNEWYVPSIREMLLIRLNCKDRLHESVYWSSTQVNEGLGMCVRTTRGPERYDIEAPENNGYYVALVKRIPVEYK